MAADQLNISPIGFGAFKIGRNAQIKYPTAFDLPDDESSTNLLNTVLDMGINFIDTAPAYGISEQRIGQALSHRRSEFTLATKVGETFSDGKSAYAFDQKSVRRSVEQSLKRLRTDTIDLLFIHAPRDDLRTLTQTDIVETMQKLRDEGKTKKIGFSGYTEAAFQSALDWADAIMVEYHLNDRSLASVIADAGKRSLSVIVKKGLASGNLDANSATTFVLQNPNVTSLVIGSLNSDHLHANIQSARNVRPNAFAGK